METAFTVSVFLLLAGTLLLAMIQAAVKDKYPDPLVPARRAMLILFVAHIIASAAATVVFGVLYAVG